MKKIIKSAALFLLAGMTLCSCAVKGRKVVKVGLLHSLTGTMAISEVAVRDAELLAIKELLVIKEYFIANTVDKN